MKVHPQTPPNSVFTVRFAHSNSAFGGTSYMLGTLSDILPGGFKNTVMNKKIKYCETQLRRQYDNI